MSVVGSHGYTSNSRRPPAKAFEHKPLPKRFCNLDRFIPPSALRTPWIENARTQYTFDLKSSLNSALKDLSLFGKIVGFDEPAFAMRSGLYDLKVIDAYVP